MQVVMRVLVLLLLEPLVLLLVLVLVRPRGDDLHGARGAVNVLAAALHSVAARSRLRPSAMYSSLKEDRHGTRRDYIRRRRYEVDRLGTDGRIRLLVTYYFRCHLTHWRLGNARVQPAPRKLKSKVGFLASPEG